VWLKHYNQARPLCLVKTSCTCEMNAFEAASES
jgi:hypothetical protein